MKSVLYRVSKSISRSENTQSVEVESVKVIKEGEKYYSVENKHFPENDIIVLKENLTKLSATYNPLRLEVWSWTDRSDNFDIIKEQIEDKIAEMLDREQKVIDEFKELANKIS